MLPPFPLRKLEVSWVTACIPLLHYTWNLCRSCKKSYRHWLSDHYSVPYCLPQNGISTWLVLVIFLLLTEYYHSFIDMLGNPVKETWFAHGYSLMIGLSKKIKCICLNSGCGNRQTHLLCFTEKFMINDREVMMFRNFQNTMSLHRFSLNESQLLKYNSVILGR